MPLSNSVLERTARVSLRRVALSVSHRIHSAVILTYYVGRNHVYPVQRSLDLMSTRVLSVDRGREFLFPGFSTTKK